MRTDRQELSRVVRSTSREKNNKLPSANVTKFTHYNAYQVLDENVILGKILVHREGRECSAEISD